MTGIELSKSLYCKTCFGISLIRNNILVTKVNVAELFLLSKNDLDTLIDITVPLFS